MSGGFKIRFVGDHLMSSRIKDDGELAVSELVIESSGETKFRLSEDGETMTIAFSNGADMEEERVRKLAASGASEALRLFAKSMRQEPRRT